MVFILLLVVVVLVVGGMMFFGLGAGLWAKRTEPGGDPSASGPDLVDEEMTTTAAPRDNGKSRRTET